MAIFIEKKANKKEGEGKEEEKGKAPMMVSN